MRQVGHLEELHKKYFDKGFRVVAISSENSGVLESKMIEGKKVSYWIGADPGRDTMSGFTQPGRIGIPHSYLVDASGRVVGEGMPSEAQIEKLLEKTFDPALGRELDRKLRSAVKYYEKGDIGKAWEKAERYTETDDRAVNEDARYLRKRAEEYAAWLKGLVESSIESKSYEQVFEDLERLQDDFKGMPVAEWAEETEKSLDKDPKVKDEMKAWKYYRRAREVEQDAGGNERKLAAAAAYYERVVKKYPATRAAEMARKALGRLNK